MQDIEPYYQWLHLYSATEDSQSPFYEREYSEFEYSNAVYNFVIHPQWDHFGSPTLYIKILFADYEQGFAIIEMIGEWNDAITNDIMLLKREVIDLMVDEGITKFILIGENLLNFHASDDSYYEEWFQDIEEGWIVLLNFRDHVLSEMKDARLDYYLNFGAELDDLPWRTYSPYSLFDVVDGIMGKRLG
ncbi:MAG: hypothetical protein H7321_08290 [Bacteroidia bacterium]|nr:hypothetical protein [Bacteroidia bacterium]